MDPNTIWGQLYYGLMWFTPIVAVLALYYAHRAAELSARNNAVLESIWTLLKAVRLRQENEGKPPSADAGGTAAPNLPLPPEKH